MNVLNQRLINQKDCECNLRESLVDWQKVLDGYIHRFGKCNVNNNSLLQDIQVAIQQLEVSTISFRGGWKGEMKGGRFS